MALLARLRILVQQMLPDVILVFNKVSSLSQQKHLVKLTQGGIEAFREYYPSSEAVLTLECVWTKDKFVLIEKTRSSSTSNQNEDQNAFPLETSIKYETLPCFGEVSSTEHEPKSDEALNPSLSEEIFAVDVQPAIISSENPSAIMTDGTITTN